MKGLGGLRRGLLVGAVAGLFLGGWSVFKWGRQEVAGDQEPAVLPPLAERPARPPGTPRPGDAVLVGYGSAERSVEQDLAAVAEVVGNLALLVKGPDPLPLGSNEELTAALLGRNRAGVEMISAECPAVNGKGQMVDRWGTPLFFHAKARDRIDIRSAGPDRQMWTEDDAHRLHDGRLLRGEALEAASLFGVEER